MIIFFKVADNLSKQKAIANIALECFERKMPLQILVPNAEAAAYVDDLLWRLPEDSFLPHAVSEQPSLDFLVITTKKGSLNQAKALLNLSKEPFLEKNFEIIYELWDMTSQPRFEASEKRYKTYEQNNLPITLKS